MIDPSNAVARLNYAEILEMNGMYETYLSQLLFIKENEQIKIDSSIEDKIEAYNSLLD